jgi:hypothetical protein
MADSARPYIVTAVAVIVGAIIFMSPKNNSTSTTGATAAATSTSTQIPIPDDQARFIAANDAGRTAYKAGANDMAKGAARPYRAQSLCRGAQIRNVQNWVGKVATLSSNGDGKGVLSVMIGNDVQVKTWNNSMSDIGDQTLIEPTSALFRKAVSLQVGQVVTFSGSFIPSQTDCVRESSMTLDGSMTRPEYIFKFLDIAALK